MPAKVMLVHQTAPLNPPEEARTGSAVSLLRLIFTVLHLGFSRFFIILIFIEFCNLQTTKRKGTHWRERTRKQMMKSGSSQRSTPFFSFLQANAHVRFDPVY